MKKLILLFLTSILFCSCGKTYIDSQYELYTTNSPYVAYVLDKTTGDISIILPKNSDLQMQEITIYPNTTINNKNLDNFISQQGTNPTKFDISTAKPIEQVKDIDLSKLNLKKKDTKEN